MQQPWKQTSDALLKHFQSAESGLPSAEAAKRLHAYGPNRLETGKGIHPFYLFIAQFRGALTLLLAGAALLALISGSPDEAISIAAVLMVNAIMGFGIELFANRSMDKLKSLEVKRCKVYRDGSLRDVPAEALVPGDVIFLDAGDIVPADARLLSLSRLSMNESVLTGESLPVSKRESVISDAALGDRFNMVWRGTSVTTGNAKALVTATGPETEIGQVVRLAGSTERAKNPLQDKLDFFSRRLAWVAALMCVPMAVAGWLRNEDVWYILESAIALIVAAIPEGLPVVATISLANGMLRLAKQNVIVKDLNAVETLGSTTVILTDKTGTLTLNRLRVQRLLLPGRDIEMNAQLPGSGSDSSLKMLLTVSLLCNNAGDGVGDPLEVALLEMGEAFESGLSDKAKAAHPRLKEEPFDPETRMMGTLHEKGDLHLLAVKGAAEEMIRDCSRLLSADMEKNFSAEEKQAWLRRVADAGSQGYKVLGFAYTHPEEHSLAFRDLVFIGAAAFLDPPREEVPEAIHDCHQAGIRVVMVTGDHPGTAEAIARSIGFDISEAADVVKGDDFSSTGKLNPAEKKKLSMAHVFSRVSPLQKLELVELYQEQGEIVAMTGDGVNDAPALKKAEVGIAMGLRGTEVAREASKMVLMDDSFSSIVRAIRYGRSVLDNVKTFIRYLLACNLSEVLVVSLASMMPWSKALHPLQILFLNLVTDVFPALALGMGKGQPGLMHQPPADPKRPLLSGADWRGIFLHALNLTSFSLAAGFAATLWMDARPEMATDILFFCLGFGQLLFVFNLRKPESGFLRNEITRNPHLWAALLFCCLLLVSLIVFEPAGTFFHTLSPDMKFLPFILAGSAGPVLLYQLILLLRSGLKKQTP